MGLFRIAQLSDLARQLLFTPTETRLKQILAAEELLLQLDPGKGYPFDFILFRITGYHAKPSAESLAGAESGGGFTGQLLTGLALQHDLGLLIERVSESLRQHVAALDEPVLSIEDVCQKFNVSDKSLQRWRRRGLAGRRFIFPDGRNRIGFLTASVERFFSAHRDQAEKVADSKAADPDEQERIIRMAARLAKAGCCTDEVAERVGRRFARSQLTICYVCQHHSPKSAEVLTKTARPLSQRHRAAIGKVFARGTSLSTIAQRLRRPKSAIYRVLAAQRWERLNRTRIRFIDDPLYHQPDAADVIDSIYKAGELVTEEVTGETRVPKGLPKHFQTIYRQPLLSAAKERAVFLKLNFHKFQFVSLQRKMEGGLNHWRDLEELESHLSAATAIKNLIVSANLRLVISTARRHLPSGISISAIESILMELISDGNITLIRTVDAFDFHRGTRFGTYATFALMKGFARELYRHKHQDVPFTDEISEECGLSDCDRLMERETLGKLLGTLEERERDVVCRRFGLTERGVGEALEEIADEMGLSKERVRMIEFRALKKLRTAAEA